MTLLAVYKPVQGIMYHTYFSCQTNIDAPAHFILKRGTRHFY